jgi:hypothetical protein
MAVSIPIVTEFQNRGIKAAEAAFVDFRKQVGQAEGAMGKFKAGSKSVMDSVKANSATFATAAGAAFVTFAAKGVTAFQDLALSADKFAGATGLAVEEASRLLEVTGDLGIEAGSVETAIGKMNQNLGKSPDLFKELGVQVEYAKDGTVDANETFLNVIDRLNRIKDPAQKAKVATQLLGKGWRDMSQLIMMGSDDLRKSLAQVSDAKTISPEEAAKAKKFRDNMNDLKDTVEDLSLQIGEVLVPAIANVVETANKLQVGQVGGGFLQSLFGTPTDKFIGQMNMINGLFKVFGVNLDKAKGNDNPIITAEEVNNLQMAARDLEDANQQTLNQIKYGKLKPFKDTAESANSLATAIQNVDKRWQMLVDNLNNQVSLDTLEQSFAEVEVAANQAFGTGAQQDIANYNSKYADFVGLLASIAAGMDNISSRQIQLRLETKGAAEAKALALWLAGGAELTGLSQQQLLDQAGLGISIPGRAMGGAVSSGTYLVGERGPELLTLSGAQAGTVGPVGGGSTVINVSTSADPNQVVAAIQQWVRDNGAVPMTTTTAIRR